MSPVQKQMGDLRGYQGLAGISRDLQGSPGTCRDLQGPARISRDLQWGTWVWVPPPATKKSITESWHVDSISYAYEAISVFCFSRTGIQVQPEARRPRFAPTWVPPSREYRVGVHSDRIALGARGPGTHENFESIAYLAIPMHTAPPSECVRP